MINILQYANVNAFAFIEYHTDFDVTDYDLVSGFRQNMV